MKVQDVMTSNVRTCRLESNLAEVVREMWEGDCGVLPVVGPDDQVIAVITDRDVCVAVGTKGRKAERIAVREVASNHQLHTCLPTDETTAALKTMQANKVRRLPVIDREGHLQGIVSLNDLATHAGAATPTQIANALASICEHRTQIVAANSA